jgi:hypothetical protein
MSSASCVHVCKVVGLDVRNPTDLGDTYASILLMVGMSPAYFQKQLRRSSTSITMDNFKPLKWGQKRV